MNDGVSDSEEATISITVIPVNDAPLANDIKTATELNTPVEITIGGSDVDGDTLTYEILTQPEKGSLVVPDNFGAGNLTLEYTPQPTIQGADIFTYKVSDGNGGEDIGEVKVQVGASPRGKVYTSSADFNAGIAQGLSLRVADEVSTRGDSSSSRYVWVVTSNKLAVAVDVRSGVAINSVKFLPDGN